MRWNRRCSEALHSYEVSVRLVERVLTKKVDKSVVPDGGHSPVNFFHTVDANIPASLARKFSGLGIP